MPAFNDRFAFAAPSYASCRPGYPDGLFLCLASSAERRERAWDCGTGSGQAATALAAHFRVVIATDASLVQLENARRAEGVHYVAMTAEHTALGSHTMDLVTVAQALHWFDRQLFFAEVDRVLRPGGTLAVWSYGLIAMEPAIDRVLDRFYRDTLGPYWPPERSLVENGYAGIVLPFPEMASPPFVMETRWTLAQLAGYISTWSAVGRYQSCLGVDPLPELMRSLASLWGRCDSRPVRWPLILRLARKVV